MNMNGKMKILMCRLVICLSVFLTACGTAESDNADVTKGNQAVGSIKEKEREWVYVPEMIETWDEKADYGNMRFIGGYICYISMNGETEGDTQNICRYSIKNKELDRTPVEWPADGKIREISAYAFNQDYSVCMVVNAYPADFSKLRRFLCRFDLEGNNIFSGEITEQLGRETSIRKLAADGRGRSYIFTEDTGIWLYDENGNFHGSIPYDTEESIQVKGVADGEGDKLYVCVGKGENADSCTLMEVNFESCQMTEFIKDFPDISGIGGGREPGGVRTQPGGDFPQKEEDLAPQDKGGNYDLYLYDDSSVYRYDLASQKEEELFDWADSDINGYFVRNFGLSADGRYYAVVEDWENEDRSVVMLDKMRTEDAPQKENMVLAAVNRGSSLTALAVKFNRSNNQYHLTVKNYETLTDLYNAILAGEAMDIIDLSGVNAQRLSRQGVFEDLAPWLEQSEDFERSDFVDGILGVYTFDGTLVGIPESFTLQTVVGDGISGGGLSLEGLLAVAQSNPGALPFDGITKEEMMQYLMMFNEDTFIDRDTGECHFDSDTFKELLELVKRFPDDAEGGQGEDSLPVKIHNGQVLFAIADIDELRSLQLYEGMFEENGTCIGFPTEDGEGGTLLFTENAFGITAASKNKSGAWKFIESVLKRRDTDNMEREEVSALYSFHRGFPALRKTLDMVAEYRIEEDGKTLPDRFPVDIFEDGWEFQYHALTWDEINATLDLLKKATPAFYVEDDAITQIINEEAQAYYSGQKSVEDAADVIQNRARIYVSENM